MESETREMPEKTSYGSWQDQDSERTKRLLLLSCSSTLALIVLICFLLVTQKDELYLSAPATYKKNLLEDVCYNGFQSIVNREVLDPFVEKPFANFLRDSKYQNVNVSPRSEDYRLIQKLTDTTCRVVIKANTNNGINLRGFLVTMTFSASYPFQYKVSQISESFLEESDKELK